MRIYDVKELGIERVVDWLRNDVTHNLFAIYDLRYQPQNTVMRLAVDDHSIKGYVLLYTGLRYPVVILRAALDALPFLLDRIPEREMVLFA